MSFTVNIYYIGKNGSAKEFAREMTESGLVNKIRAEEGNERYEYFFPLDDPETMSLFHSCKALKYKGENPDTDPILGDLGCVAVPEFGTKFVRGMVKETHPSTFAELVSISGLSHGTDVWLGNAAELVRKGIPLSGCICCRDDIMNYLISIKMEPSKAFKIMESVMLRCF